MFDFLKSKKDPDRIETDDEQPYDRMEKAPRSIKLLVNLKTFISETDPLRVILFASILALVAFIIIGFALPWLEVIQDVPSKIPILTAISFFTLGVFFYDFKMKTIIERICELSIDGRTFLVDNRRIDLTPGGEILYRVNSSGKPLYNHDESNMRTYGKQKTIFIPKQVLDQFDTVRGHKAKAYPQCKLKETRLNDVNYGIYYVPTKVSESRLLKRIETTQANLEIYREMIDQFINDTKKIVNDLHTQEASHLKGIVNNISMLQKAMYGTPEQIAKQVRQQSYQMGAGSRYPYSSRFSHYGNPSWSNVNPTPNQFQPLDDEGDSE